MPTRVLMVKVQTHVQHYEISIAGGHASTHNQLMCCHGLLMPSLVLDNMTSLISRRRRK